MDSQYDTVNIVGQYDIFSDPPERMGNLLADLNGITAGGYYGHSATAFSDPARVAPGDITTTINDKGATTTTYLIRADELPLVRALVDMAGLPPEAARPLNAVLKPMVDRAYGPPHAPLPNPGDLIQGVRQVHGIAPAISIPIESTNAGITAATTAVSAANVANAATHAAANAVSGANAGKGAKGIATKVGDVLPKSKK